jgi:hypothetical protein
MQFLLLICPTVEFEVPPCVGAHHALAEVPYTFSIPRSLCSAHSPLSVVIALRYLNYEREIAQSVFFGSKFNWFFLGLLHLAKQADDPC